MALAALWAPIGTWALLSPKEVGAAAIQGACAAGAKDCSALWTCCCTTNTKKRIRASEETYTLSGKKTNHWQDGLILPVPQFAVSTASNDHVSSSI